VLGGGVMEPLKRRHLGIFTLRPAGGAGLLGAQTAVVERASWNKGDCRVELGREVRKTGSVAYQLPGGEGGRRGVGAGTR